MMIDPSRAQAGLSCRRRPAQQANAGHLVARPTVELPLLDTRSSGSGFLWSLLFHELTGLLAARLNSSVCASMRGR